MHEDYEAPPFDQADPDPIVQFRVWFDAARGLYEPEAMLLSTADAAARYVLLRGVDSAGFRFYTNYRSAKARAIEADPRVGLTFGWLALHRSVRVAGAAERLPEAESDAYFASRPRGAQLGAWASPQSEVIEAPVDTGEVEARFDGVEVPRPPFWGGFLVQPETIEFWQGRPNRLHDRLRYRFVDGAWVVERLAP